jgi:hypothetical protein
MKISSHNWRQFYGAAVAAASANSGKSSAPNPKLPKSSPSRAKRATDNPILRHRLPAA